MWKLFRRRLRYYFQFVPITGNAVLCGLALWLLYRILYRPPVLKGRAVDPADEQADGAFNVFQPFIMLMGRIALLLIVLFIALSVFSALIAWLHFLWLKKKKGTVLELQFSTETKTGRSNKVFLNAALEGAFRPFLGFVKGRLFYDDYQLTGKFSLLSNKRREGSFLRRAINGKSRISLPDIKEYQLRGGFVFFEDMLHLFSFAVAQPAGGNFYQPPVLRKHQEQEVAPRKTETTDIRIDQMRRVEGEYLNYKDFEAGDDVRRIVWKVYAKNRDLVVRVPEKFEPYASHLYFYASFHTALREAWVAGDYGKEMLNYFKNAIWTVYDTLAAKAFEMRYISDQPATVPEGLKEADRVGRIISSSSWHNDKSLNNYFNVRQGTVLCISSLTDSHELAQLLESADSGTVIYFVKLSRSFHHFIPLSWLKRLIFLPSEDRLSKLRDRWIFSPLRLQIGRREKEIDALLKKSGATVQVI
jgi:hypothetical protein